MINIKIFLILNYFIIIKYYFYINCRTKYKIKKIKKKIFLILN